MEQLHWVIVGLGNPGKEYEMTRHNIGFTVLEALAYDWKIEFNTVNHFQARLAKKQKREPQEAMVTLLLPMTYMNESGRAVKAYLDYYKLEADSLIIVNDDIDLNYTAMRLKPSGSAGGHNGLKSIEKHLNTQQYKRLRLGVGKNKEKTPLADHVLGSFNQEERKVLPTFVERAEIAIELIITAGIDKAMQQVNTKEQLF